MSQIASAVLQLGTRMLQQAIGDGAIRDARILMSHTLEIPHNRLSIELSQPITPKQVAQFETMIQRRAEFEPVSHLTGKRLFWGRGFRVTADVLDPRPETETLIDLALKGPEPKTILDLGTGSGCILVTLLAEWQTSTGKGTDISERALAIACENANKLGIGSRARFQIADWFNGIAGRFDLIVSNPPYISASEMIELAPDVREYEPHTALTPGGDGLSPFKIIAGSLSDKLSQDGRAFFEFGHRQGPDVAQIFCDAGFSNVKIHKDMSGHDRIIAVTR